MEQNDINNIIDMDYINIHSEVLNKIDNDFWKEEICKLLKNEITNVDNETRQSLFNNPYGKFIICNDCFITNFKTTHLSE